MLIAGLFIIAPRKREEAAATVVPPPALRFLPQNVLQQVCALLGSVSHVI
jgi:hypothetical protein